MNPDTNVHHQRNDNDETNTKPIPRKCRNILWYLTFAACLLESITRINLNIAIVNMVLPNSIVNYELNSTKCINQDTTYTAMLLKNQNNFSHNEMAVDVKTNNRFSIERFILGKLQINYDEMGFNWNGREQNLVLGSYFWFNWLMKIPAGVMTRTYGAKKVLGISLLIVCLLSSFAPLLAFTNLWLIIILRVIQGMLGAFTWPAVLNIVAQWIPPNERSKFLLCLMANSIGLGLFYPIFGYIIAISSWEWTFHLLTLMGIIWFIFWQYFMYDSPTQHPHIDIREKEYILNALGDSFSHHHQKIETPWKAILTSIPVWMNMLVQFGNMWSTMTLTAQIPTYLTQIIGFDIATASLISGLPHLLRVVFAYTFSTYADYLLRSQKISRTNVRKLAIFLASVLSGLFVISFAYAGCHVTSVIILLALSIIVTGDLPSGALASVIDLSPNFAGVLTGLIGTVCLFPGLMSPYIVGILTYQNQTIQQWQYVFLISSGWVLSTGILYLFLSESKLQPWNSIQ